MITPKRNLPPHNYARIADSFPPLRKEITDTFSNEFERQSLINSNTEDNEKIYLILHNGAYYRGPWKNGFPHGKGLCIFADGTYYEGMFQQGEAEDQNAYLVLPNGAVYKGSIIKSVIEGYGEMKHSIEKQQVYYYKGSWKYGKPDGKGEELYGDGSKYVGYFKNGVKHSYDSTKTIEQKMKEFNDNGKLQISSTYKSTATQQTYQGQFFKGLMHGFGEYYRLYHDRSIRYTGQFNRGKKKGYGALHTELGTLIGNFENDVVNGEGRFQWDPKDGRIYIGNFLNSKFHGQGKIILNNGSTLEGLWQEGHSKELTGIKQKNEHENYR